LIALHADRTWRAVPLLRRAHHMPRGVSRAHIDGHAHREINGRPIRQALAARSTHRVNMRAPLREIVSEHGARIALACGALARTSPRDDAIDSHRTRELVHRWREFPP
jgi:hypothetical protein